jgi:hypothetical protein
VFILFLQQAETKAKNRATAEETTRARARERAWDEKDETRRGRPGRERRWYTAWRFTALPLYRFAA